MEPMTSFHEKRFHAVGGFIITKSYGRLDHMHGELFVWLFQ